VADTHSTKIALSDIANLEQLIDQAPARQATDVSKRRAIGILAPKLYELRGKGYAWREVAAWLTEHGLTVTVPALQRYLRGVRPPAINGATGRPTAARSTASRDGKAVPRSPPASSVDTTAISPGRGQRNVPPVGPPAAEGTARIPRPELRRSEFVPRPDTKDI
jgi:hypothetical protein